MKEITEDAMTTTQALFDHYVKPYFAELNCEVRFVRGEEPATIQITRVYDKGNDRLLADEQVAKILSIMNDRYGDQGAALTLTPGPAICGPIAGATFLRFVLPFFNEQGWKLNYETDPGSGSVMVKQVIMRNDLPCRTQTARAMIAESLPVHSAGAPPKAPAPEKLPAEETLRTCAASSDIFDYKKLRENPENAVALKDYQETLILVDRSHMVETVRPAFEDMGWIYGGNHYGDGTVGFQVVITYHDKVVSQVKLREALTKLEVPYSEVTISRRGGAVHRNLEDGGAGDVWEEPVPVTLAGLDYEEIERQDVNAAAMEQEETPAGVLVLLPEHRLTVSAKYSEETGSVDLRLEIGTNIVWVHCSLKQATEFLIDGSLILLTELHGSITQLRVTSTDESGVETQNVICHTEEEMTEDQMEAKQNDEEASCQDETETTNAEEEIQDE